MAQQVVILVLAHRAEPLRGLLSLLDERFCVIVHFDAKAGPEPALPGHARFVAPRVPVFWGGFNTMRAIRALLDAAYRTAPGFRVAALVTGDSLPLLPPDALEAALLDGPERIDLVEVADEPGLRGVAMAEAERRGAILAWRFQNHTDWDDELLSPKSREEVGAKYGVALGTADYLRGSAERIAAAALAGLPPRARLFERLYYGSSWWALSRQACDLVVDDLHAPGHEAYFRYLQVPDEHMVQTILGNKRRALAGRAFGRGPVFVDHADPDRAGFREDALSFEGFRAAAAGGFLFARKYDPCRTPELAAAVGLGWSALWG